MEIDELREEILDIVDSDDITDEQCTDKINKGLLYIAARVLLPALEQYTTIDVPGRVFADNFIDLPDDYHRNLFYCNDGADFEIKSNVAELRRAGVPLSGESWRLCAVSNQRQILFSDTIPVNTEITLGYYRKPEDGEISVIPAGYEDAVLNFCCWKFFAKIEDGDDGRKPNTEYYKSFKKG